MALKVLAPNQIKTLLLKPLAKIFFTTCCSKATVSKQLVSRNKYGHAKSFMQGNISTSALHTRYYAYHAQNDDYNFEVVDVEPKKEFFHERGKKVIAKSLQKELDCTKIDAETMIKACNPLTRLTHYDIAERVQCFLRFDLKNSLIMAYPWLLTVKLEDIPLRIKYFKDIGLEFEEGVYLLKLTTKMIRKLSEAAKRESNKENRLRHLGKLLDMNLPEVCQIVAKHPFLCTIPYQRLGYIMNTLLAHNITREHILKDMWVFRYDPLKIENRLEKAAAVGYPNIKPWLIHCSEKTFERSLERKTQVLDTLGPNGSVEQYLAHRLNCSCENVRGLYHNYPLITTVHINKMKETLDYLFAEDFTADQIKLVPRILCHSLDTIKVRLAELRQLGHPPSSLYTLCLSKRQFSEHVKKLKIRHSQGAASA